MKLTKADFVGRIAAKLEGEGFTKKEAAAAMNAVFSAAAEALAEGNSVPVAQFGTFSAVERPERVCRNPKTGESLTVPAHTVVSFKPASSLKDLVNTKNA